MDLGSLATLHWKTQRVLMRAAGRVTQEGNLVKQLRVYGRIVAGGGPIPTSANVNGQRVITFPISWFDTTAKIQPTIILGENLEDAFTLQKFAEAGTVLSGLGHLPLNSSPDHGGGSATGTVLHLNAASNRPCLCIVDSDRSHPTDELGSTATAVQPYKNPALHPLVEVSETNGRDLENLLPDSFYHSSYGSHANYGPLAALMGDLTASLEMTLRAHLDVERGVFLLQLFNFPAGSPGEVFWRSNPRWQQWRRRGGSRLRRSLAG
ncbi:MAG: hypothetical protein NTV51_13140 [Verrucomicrobia bacterium]|nr:hypothetical protein [Verrucomicrobiota bacterium]